MQATAGTIGFPFPAIEFRLESIPEMNYDAQGTPARGELCIRGNTLFEGYYKQQASCPERACKLAAMCACRLVLATVCAFGTAQSPVSEAVTGAAAHFASVLMQVTSRGVV